MTAKTIPVVATGRGFYNTRLRREGDRFVVKSEKDLGTWMKRLDVQEPEPEVQDQEGDDLDPATGIGDPDLPPEPPGQPRGPIKPQTETLSGKLTERPQTAGEFYGGKAGGKRAKDGL